MADSNCVLVGLYPPSNVARSLYSLKESLFRDFTAVSALAAGPVVPLAYPKEPPAVPDPNLLPRGVDFTTGRWAVYEGTLFLTIEPADLSARFRAGLGPGAANPKAPPAGRPYARPIPVFPGLYMLSLREDSSRRRWSGSNGDAVAGAAPIGSDGTDQVDTLHDLGEPNAAALIGPPPRLRWTGSDLVCWRLTSIDPERWWDGVEIEECWSVRLRRTPS